MSFSDRFFKAIREWLLEHGEVVTDQERVKNIGEYDDGTHITIKNRLTKNRRVVVRKETLADIVAQGRIGRRM